MIYAARGSGDTKIDLNLQIMSCKENAAKPLKCDGRFVSIAYLGSVYLIFLVQHLMLLTNIIGYKHCWCEQLSAFIVL